MRNKYNTISVINKIRGFILSLLIVVPILVTAQTQAPSIRTGVIFDWSDDQDVPPYDDNLPATIESVTIDGIEYNTFVIPSAYSMDRVGINSNANIIRLNGGTVIQDSNLPGWNAAALDAFQDKNLNHYFTANPNGQNICNDFSAVETTSAQKQIISYNIAIPSNDGGVLAVTERGGNNCFYVEIWGYPTGVDPNGGSTPVKLGETFVRNGGVNYNTNCGIASPPSNTNTDYWKSDRCNENGQSIAIALFYLDDIAPNGSHITSIEFVGASNDHGDGKFFLLQKYAVDQQLIECLDETYMGDLNILNNAPSGSRYTITSGPTPASAGSFNVNLDINGTFDGTYEFVPAPGYIGDIKFNYELCLPAPNTSVCDTGEVTLMYVDLPPKPTFNIDCGLGDDNFTITVESPINDLSTSPPSEYEYSIDGGVTYQDGISFTGLSEGSYSLIVRNKGTNCINTSTTNPIILVNDDEAPTITCPSEVTVFVDSGLCTASGVNLGNPSVNDNCNGLINITNNAVEPFMLGETTITWTATDASNNETSCTQKIIVVDNINPDTPTLADITGECSATATAPTTNDNCSGSITGTTNDPLTYNTQGTFVINWTFDDGNGNSIVVTQNVIVDDVTNPDTPTLADITGECSATATAPTTNDNCSGSITGTTNDPLTYNTQGTFVINWTFDDGNGNSIVVTQNVIVDDVTNPDTPTLADITGECSATATAPTTNDNCSGSITGTTNDPLTYNTQGTFVINWTFDDGNGNSIVVTQNVIVDDITNPDTPTLADITGECSATATAPTTNDNCSGSITGTTNDPLTYNTQGTFVINWTFDDGNGNSIVVTQNVIVDDVTNPDTPTLADITGECSATATAPTTNDNCSGSITGTTNDPLTYNTQGTFVINWTFDDGNGNSIVVTQNVIVDDITNPDTPTLADITGECSATATAPTTNDNCSGSITGTTNDPLTYNTQGTFVINWTFDDGNGNSIVVTQNVIVDDVTNPDTPTLADITGECSATATAPTTNDNCSGSITGTTNDPLTYNTQGTFVINWTFDDGNGNSIVVTQNVIVDDTTDPTAPTLADLTGECSVTATAPSITDNCNGTIITGTTTDPLTYNTQGTFVITWTFDDGNGNSIVVTQNVIVDDVTNPDTPTLADITGECSATATAPTTNDNCSGSITGTTNDPLTYNTQGTFVINWTFDDGNGNSIVVTQNVIVDDVTNPDTPTLADITGECSATATAPTTNDNCSGSITGTTNDPLTYNTQGTFVINWTFDDGNGNSIVVTQNVIVDDITNPDTPTLADITGECSATATAPTTNDNCSGSITGTTNDPLTYNTQGTFVINWTFDDGNGNSIVVTQNVIVDDITNPDTPTLADITGECSATATATAPTTNDNCSGSITGTTNDPLTYNTQGTFVINWTFDDGNGNSIVVTQNVIVDDVTNPDTPTLADITGECSATATAPTTNDNCSGSITGTTNDPLTYNTQGTFVINWTFDDGNGNSIVVTQNVIVDDTTDPTAPTLADLTGECLVTATAPSITDNCNGTIITGTTTDPLTYNTQGTFVITWTFDDGNGNSIVVTQNVIVDDITNPDTPTLADITGECSATATAPTTNDNCSGSITGTTIDPLTYNTQGTFVINWTFDDGNGNSIVVTQNVIVDDVTNPDTPTLADITGECSATATAPTTNDNCSGSITGTTNDPLTYNTQGTFVINWTFDDGNGNSIVVTQNVIVDDITNPDTPTLADITGECSATATAPTTNDNCSGSITGTTNDPLTYNIQGTFVINWTFDDGNGNSIVVTQNVIVDDVTNPDTPTLADITGECSATATAPTTNDNCSGSITGTTNDPLTYNTQGTFVINWTFDDGNGNSIVVTQNVIVDDTTDPTAPTLADLTGECLVTATAPSITDNCNGTIITGTTTDPLTYNTQGTFVITWTFDDGNGNSIDVNQNVIVDDVTNPDTPTLADITGECSAIATAPTTNDNCSGSITGTTTDPLTYNTQGTFVINWTFDDGNGNSIVVTQNVIVDDNENPNIDNTNTDNIEIECGVGNTQIQLTDWLNNNAGATATDNCSDVTWSNNYGSDDTVQCDNGAITVVFTATDAYGNFSTTTATYLIKDTVAPVISTQAADQTVQCDGGGGGNTTALNDWLANNGGAVATDDCSAVTWSNDFAALSDLCGATGAVTVTFTATDACNNSSTTTATFTIEDTTNPTWDNAPADLTVECDGTADPNGAFANWLTSFSGSDNCSNATVTTNSTGLSDLCGATGTETVNFTLTDECGNSISADATFTIQDTTNPTWDNAPSNMVMECDGVTNINDEFSDWLSSFSGSDTCGSATVTHDSTGLSNTCGNSFTETVTFTLTDECNNSISMDATFGIADTTPPSWDNIPTDMTVECDGTADPNGAFANWLTSFSGSDTCGVTTVTNNSSGLSDLCGNTGTETVIFILSDDCGNSVSAEATFTIEDTTNPTFSDRLPENITVECDAIPNPENITASDNCGSAEVTVNDTNISGACDGSYTIERTYTATDECGLSIAYTQTINVIDTTAPVPTTDFETELTVSCTEIPDAPSVEFIDNCSNNITIVFNETNGFDDTVFEDYQIIRSWTVKDACDNEARYTQTLNIILDEVITEVTGPDRCFDDGTINLNEFLTSQNQEGTWELIEGDDMAELNGNIFNPTTLEPSENFLPGSAAIDYVFRYTGLENGCINITEVSMAINADCIVLPCGENDIIISKAVTPNGDLINDFFYIAGIKLCGFQANIRIFNRWGALVFESSKYSQINEVGDNPDDENEIWRGKAKSSVGGASTVPNGTYYYIIELRNPTTGILELEPITGPVYIGSK